MTEIACVECGKPFQKKKWNHVCCSEMCSIRNWRARNSEKWKKYLHDFGQTRNKGPATVCCEVCGTPFSTPRRDKRFCSKKCYNSITYSWGDEMLPSVKCEHCHGVFQPVLKDQNCCSQRCNAAMIGPMTPEQKSRHNLINPKWLQPDLGPHKDLRRSNAAAYSPWRVSLASRRSASARDDLPFDLTNVWAAERWTGRCELTDIPFVFGSKKTMGPSPHSVTIDRINPSFGYVANNCRFVLHAVNAMKSDGDDEMMFAIAEGLVSKRRSAAIAAASILSLPG